MDQKKLRKLAEQRVQAKQGFFIHFTVYVLVNLFLFISYLYWTIDRAAPVIYTALFWGIGIGFHWYYVFIHSDSGKQERRIAREMEKISEEEKD